jgi:gluconate 2-dehydrogenase gamma chain
MTISRRTLLRHLALVAASPLASPLLSQAKGMTEFSETILKHAVDRLLPGAAEAGVVDFMRYWFDREPAFVPLSRYLAAGAEKLDETAKKHHGKWFAACIGATQDTILQRFASGSVNARGFDGRLFYRQLMELTLEGYLSDPKYGGNRNRRGWALIGKPDGLRSCWWNPNGVKTVLAPEDGFND